MLCYLCCLPRWVVWGQWCLETSRGKERRHLAHFLLEKLAEEATRECLARGRRRAKVVLVTVVAVVHLSGKIGKSSAKSGICRSNLKNLFITGKVSTSFSYIFYSLYLSFEKKLFWGGKCHYMIYYWKKMHGFTYSGDIDNAPAFFCGWEFL